MNEFLFLRKIKSIICVYFLISILPLAISAAANTIEKIINHYSSASSFQSDITLHTYWKVREKQQSRTGQLIIASGNKFRITLGSMIWVCDGQTLWQYSKAASQVIIRHLKDVDLKFHPAYFITTFLSRLDYSIVKQTSGEAIIKCENDSLASILNAESIVLTLDKKKAVLRQAVIEDKNGNINTYVFSNTKFGRSFSPSTFVFNTPAGCNILDERE